MEVGNHDEVDRRSKAGKAESKGTDKGGANGLPIAIKVSCALILRSGPSTSGDDVPATGAESMDLGGQPDSEVHCLRLCVAEDHLAAEGSLPCPGNS